MRCLHQRDPFPGGHVYKLSVRSPAARRFIPNIEGGFYEKPNSEICSSVFRGIEAILGRQCEGRVSHSEATYFLNSTDSLVVKDSEVSLSGVCSPIGTPPTKV